MGIGRGDGQAEKRWATGVRGEHRGGDTVGAAEISRDEGGSGEKQNSKGKETPIPTAPNTHTQTHKEQGPCGRLGSLERE